MVTAAELKWFPVRVPCGLRYLPIFALVTCHYATPLIAGPQDYEGKRLAHVNFDPAEQPLYSVDLQRKIALLKIGQPLRQADIQATIEKLFASGRYEDIAIDAKLEGSDVTVTFITKNVLFVRDVRVTGVPDPPNQGQLVTATKLQLGYPYARNQLRQSIENLKEALRSNGFYLAKVESQESPPLAAEQIDVSFSIEPAARARFDTPIIKGDPGRPIDRIVRASRWKRFFGLGWSPVTESRVQSGLDRIRRLYQKEGLLMAKVNLEEMEYHEDTNRLVPVLSVTPGSKVLVQTEGAKVSKGKLRQLIPIYQEQSVDKDLLVEGQKNLTEYFQTQGYFETSVAFQIEKGSQNQQVIDYTVDRGSIHRLMKIFVTGNKYFITQTIRERMYITPATLIRFRHGRFSEDYLKRDIQAITDLYKANGFQDVQVAAQTIDDFGGVPRDLAVNVTIKEGPQWFTGKLEVAGISDEYRDVVVGGLRTIEGQPYSEVNVANDQDTILNFYYNRGYPGATLQSQVTPSAKPHEMDVKFAVNPGERQFVRDVLISGLQYTSPDVVRHRIRNLESGQPLSQSSLTESQRRLYDLGIFARVDTALQDPDGDESYKYVLYRIEEARKYYLTLGVGAQVGRIGQGDPTLFDAPAGSTGFSPRASIGISRTNVFGIGHTVSLQTRISNIQKRVVFSYLAPHFKGTEKFSLSFSGVYDDSRDVSTFNAKRQEAYVQLAEKFSKSITIQYRFGYRHVYVDPNSLKISAALIPILSQPEKVGLSSISILHDRRDDPSDSHRGMFNSVDLAYAVPLFGSQTTFARGLLRNSTYHRIGKDLVFARSTSFGTIIKLNSTEIPLPERFFGGGSVSHRGFPDNQAGPRDLDTGFPIGGNALLMNNFELRFPLLGDNVGGVIFHDAGNVYSHLSSISFSVHQNGLTDFDYMVHAVGFGVRYRTPIGPLRIDLAYSINPPQFIGFEGTRAQLYVPVPDPSLRVQQQISHFQFHFSLGQAF
jgi:outer membrane protein insertion porin family